MIRQHPSVKSHLCRLKTLLRLCRDCSELTAMQEIGYHKQVQCYLLLRIFFYSLILCLILEDVFRYSYADFRFKKINEQLHRLNRTRPLLFTPDLLYSYTEYYFYAISRTINTNVPNDLPEVRQLDAERVNRL